MKELQELLEKESLLRVYGMMTELGYKTQRFELKGLCECKEWLSREGKTSLKFVFHEEVVEYPL